MTKQATNKVVTLASALRAARHAKALEGPGVPVSGRAEVTFDFPVNRSFLGQSDHPITIPKQFHGRVFEIMGPIRHGHRPVVLVNAHGVELDGSIRHSQTHGSDYVQINTGDHEATTGLNCGDDIHVELWSAKCGPEVHLVSG